LSTISCRSRQSIRRPGVATRISTPWRTANPWCIQNDIIDICRITHWYIWNYICICAYARACIHMSIRRWRHKHARHIHIYIYIYICVYIYIHIYTYTYIYIYIYTHTYRWERLGVAMGWLRLVGCLKICVSLQNIGLFCRALLQKRPTFLSILLIVATPYQKLWLHNPPTHTKNIKMDSVSATHKAPTHTHTHPLSHTLSNVLGDGTLYPTYVCVRVCAYARVCMFGYACMWVRASFYI